MLLSEARSVALRLLDSEEGERYNRDGLFTEVDLALRNAQAEVYANAVAMLPSAFTREGNVTATSGVASLTVLAPYSIRRVAENASGHRLMVDSVPYWSSPTNSAESVSLSLLYVPRVVFPATDATAFDWLTISTLSSILDQWMCCVAALNLNIKANKGNQLLATRADRLQETFASVAVIPTSTPINGYQGERSAFGYFMSGPDELRLVTVTW